MSKKPIVKSKKDITDKSIIVFDMNNTSCSAYTFTLGTNKKHFTIPSKDIAMFYQVVGYKINLFMDSILMEKKDTYCLTELIWDTTLSYTHLEDIDECTIEIFSNGIFNVIDITTIIVNKDFDSLLKVINETKTALLNNEFGTFDADKIEITADTMNKEAMLLADIDINI